MAVGPKEVIRVALDAEQLVSFRKLLWERGLQPQQFFSYVVHSVILCDERLEPFYGEAVEDKKKKHQERTDDEQIDADTIYRLIEDGLKKHE